jgi:Raf kinase inhibitor-like YbhB/YbcL family protein
MRGSLQALIGGALVLVLALSGCGESNSNASSAAAQTSASSKPPSEVRLPITSAAFQAGRPIANGERALLGRYTCDGSDISPSIKWSGVPKGTAELALVIIDVTASNGGGSKRFFDWAVAGLKPTLHGVSAGKLPPGAVAGRNSFGQVGYSVCPKKGRTDTYALLLYALEKPLSLESGFEGNALFEKVASAGLPEGQSGFAYKRR